MAVLRAGPTESLIQGCTSPCFVRKRIGGLMLFGKDIGFPLAGAVRP